MLSNAGSKISSVNVLGTMDLVLAVDEEVRLLSILLGRLKVSSHGHTTSLVALGEARSSGVLLRGM